MRLQALEVIGRAGLSMGGTQLASAERAARSLIEAEPYRESGYVLLMEALALQGNVAEGAARVRPAADAAARRARDDAVARDDRRARAAAAPRHAPRSRRRRPPPPRPVSIELPAELAARAPTRRWSGAGASSTELERLWPTAASASELRRPDSAAAGSSLLAGDPGIGKTRLAAELAAARARRRARACSPGARPRRRWSPYQPFLEALRHYLLNVAARELRATAREYGSELARLIPELRRRAPDLPPPPAAEPETERYRLFEAVVGLLSAISARAPVLLVLDDLQWADRPTLLLLRHLARAPDPARLLILGAYRATEATDEGFADALADLRRERLVSADRHRRPDRARDRGAGAAADGRGAVARVRPARCTQETEGNPFFIEEIVRHLAEAGVRAGDAGARELQRFGLPEGVKQVIARRLAGSSAQAIEWLRVAAVIGRDFDAALLERVRRARRGRVPRTRSTRRWPPGWWSSRPTAGPLQLLARADPRDPLRGHVRAAPGADPPARRARRSRRRDGATAT